MKKSALILFAAASLFAADFAAEGKLWWSHVQFLADDKLQGRDTGSEGYHQAVEYVSSEFQKIGLKPAGTDGYLQMVKFETRQLVAGQSSLALVRDGKTEPLETAEASVSPRSNATEPVDAPMVFVGYGLVVPEAHWDELAGLDLKGKIAVYVGGQAPMDVSNNVKSHYSTAAERWAILKNAGAIGVATITIPRPNARGGRAGAPTEQAAGDTAAGAGAAGDNATAGRGGRGGAGAGGRGPAPPSFGLAEVALQENQGQQVAVTITRRGFDKFFAGTGHTYDEILKLVQDNKPLPHFALDGNLHATVAVKRADVEAPNVIGMLPGTDPKLKNEYVIMSAHLDHLGVGRPVNGDTIYNGAMDDASGIASVIEIARLMKGHKLKRSVIFLAVTAEEKGELGSRWFAAHPTVPADRIVADINLDMFLPLYPLKVIEVQGLTESTLGDTVRVAAHKEGVDVQVDQEPDQNRFIRSDQYSFIRRGVPALAFKFGYEQGSPEQKIRLDWVRDRYHKPSDDLSQPVDTAAAAKFDQVIIGLLERVANDSARPHWKSDSFFARFAKPSI
jgi:Zn-dependent M28 family amino/carboxypeptidase